MQEVKSYGKNNFFLMPKKKANQYWQKKEYQDLIDTLTPYLEKLPSSMQKKYQIAQKRLNSSRDQ